MPSNKKRKLDVGQGTPASSPMLSAAALRRRLLERQTSSTTSNPDEEKGTVFSENSRKSSFDAATNAADPRLKSVARAPATKDTSRTPEQVLLGPSGTVAEDDFETTEPVDEPPKRKVIQLSSFKPTKSNLQKKPDGTAVLNFPDSSERLVILGSYGVKVKTAGATIYGASLHPSDNIQWVHAPHCHALPVLRCAENSVIEIYPHPAAPGLREMERLSPLFGNLWNEFSPGGEAEKQTWQILASSADGLKRAILQDLKSPAIWNKKIADLLKTKQGPAPVILVCGPKSSGKSTFTRIITNKLVTDRGGTKKRKWPGVAVLDIDPGQPEFSPPGVISLVTLEEPNLSPPVCHPILGTNHIVRSHTVASINPASDIEHYKNCVLELFSRYRVTCTKRPLIINTPGWVQGSGLVLLQDLVSAMRPTEVLYMSEDGPEDTVEGIKSACNSTAFTALPSQSSEYTSRTAQHLRHMQAMSYFHADAEAAAVGNHAAGPRWDPRPLATAPPWLVRYDAGGSVGDGAGLLGMLCYGYQPEPELLAEAVNGTVLAIVEIEDPRAFATSEAVVTNPADPGRQTTAITTAITTTTPERLSYLRPAAPLDPRFSRCIGLALVRGLDADRRLLALSTPVRLDVDIVSGGGAVVLVSGKFDPPTWAYTEDHYHSSSYRGGGDEEEAAGEEEIPWAERLRGGEKRAAGSRVWRVRRDLGRGGAATGE